MVTRNKSANKQRQLYQSLVATALLTGSFFQFLTPVLAEGTAAGTPISNKATATYEDPNSPGTPINTTSNTVIVTVAEVAGITVKSTGVVDSNGGNVAVNDLIIFNYTITNVGNDPTGFRIPNLATTTGPATVSGTLPNGGTPNNLQYSIDNGATWINITADVVVPNIPVGGQVLVRVPVTVQAGAQNGDTITVKLGNTPANAQNVLRNPDGGDIYTVDNPDDGPNNPEVDGIPVNGTREASDTSTDVKVGTLVKTYSLATVLKIRAPYNNNNTPNLITDDTLTYGLSLRVEGSDLTGQGITPAALEGRNINLDTATVPRILVSDAIPTGTDLVSVTTPNGWTAVYTTSPISIDANAAIWTTAVPTNLATVTRVGFVNNPATITSVAPNQTITGFSIQLAVESGATSPLTVANIAQLFGQTSGNSLPVYDESGDRNPSNYDGQVGNMTPPPGTDTINVDGIPDSLPDTSVDDGFINNPATPETGVDGNNDNTGVGTAGEANIFTVEVPVASAVLNGPVNAPNAIGPSGGINDDFTNKSSLVPAGTAPNTTLNPQPVGFTNTIRNNGTEAANYSLVPLPPANNTPEGINADLPTRTLVTITYGSESRSYFWNGASFLFDADRNPATTNDQTAIDATNKYITIPNVAPGTNINYGVEIDLPDGTQLSTDIDRGFPVPITAFVDDSNAGLNPTDTIRNTTIDRVYTGFLKLRKLSRILDQNGQPVSGADGLLSNTDKKPVPGNIIEYQIQYSNISEPQSGNGNIILNASNVVITEDGVTSPNNWAEDNDSNLQIDTSNIVGSAKDSGAANITFFNGKPATASGNDQTGTTVTTDVTKYINTVTGQVAPGVQRTFTFKRKVN